MALPATCATRLATTTTAAIQPAMPSQPIAAQATPSTTANQVYVTNGMPISRTAPCRDGDVRHCSRTAVPVQGVPLTASSR